MFRIVYLVSNVWWLIHSLDIAIGILIISVTIIGIWVMSAWVLMEVLLAHNLHFLPLELINYKIIDGCTINVVWSSSHMRTLWTFSVGLVHPTSTANQTFSSKDWKKSYYAYFLVCIVIIIKKRRYNQRFSMIHNNGVNGSHSKD